MPLPFLKKKEAELGGKGFVPVERVRELASRGFSEPEIIDVLRREGFSPEEIDKGLTQSLKMGVSGEAAPSLEKPSVLPTLEEIQPPTTEEMPVLPETPLPQEYYYPYSTEDYIDMAIKERVAEVYERMEEIEARFAELEKNVKEAYDRLNEFIETRASEQEEIIKMMESFKEIATSTEGRIGSLEKAFKETLPSLIESVRALSEVVQKLKKEAP